jgi:subfamily B ATP-binding cassette protein HlyB/CyaB
MVGITDMLRCASEFGLKARAPTVKWKQLASTPVPVIGTMINYL